MELVEVRTPYLDDVVVRLPLSNPVDGTLYITGHHLILSSAKTDTQELSLMHQNVDNVERRLHSTGGSIILKCKDFKTFQLDIPGLDDCNNIANSLEQFASLSDPSKYYPLFFRPTFEIMEDGWTAFLPETEFSKILRTTDEWRISHVNKDFSVCRSYPTSVIVPKCIDDETLLASASFRQLGRFPVLSYYHQKNGAALMRSSQPMIGANGRRCKEDERLLNSLLGHGKRGYIIDTRTQNIAQMARAKGNAYKLVQVTKQLLVGGGFEPEVHYPQWRRMHKPIDRHHVLLDSLGKLMEACNDTSCSVDKWLSRLESCNWLSHVKEILNCACLVAQCIDQENASLLVHGSEGMDATLQVTSLAQVILDADCRTVRGFEALIEREWLQGGHPFALRCSHSAYTNANLRTRHQAPTFLIFLDCTWQIYQQFPCSFEFGERFLIMLFEHAYSSQFGTFLGNCDAERAELQLGSKTVSLWSYVNQPQVLSTYLNPLYEPNNRVIWPSVAPMSLTLWTGIYLRWVCDQSLQEKAWTTIIEIKEHDKQLRSRVTKLRRQLVELERDAVDAGILAAATPPEIDVS
uniref:Myotubularin phosphatase domain-containing protein n=1 Tax=Strigamia maritima TaxID=126957 RepID=T1JCY3_STRMM